MGFADFGRGLGQNNFRLKENLRLKRKNSRMPTPHGHPEQLDKQSLEKHQRLEKEKNQRMIFTTLVIVGLSFLALLSIILIIT